MLAAAFGSVVSMGLTAFLYSAFTAIVPQGSDVSLLRSLSYFGGNGVQTPLVTMVIWELRVVCSQSSSPLRE